MSSEQVPHYVPEVDHYVRHGDMEGWIYFVDKEYLTLEIMVREKSEESYNDARFHRNERCLVLVYPEDWKNLEYVKKRQKRGGACA
jgi:hypothetical protein